MSLAAVGLANVRQEERDKIKSMLDETIGNETGTISCTIWIEHEIIMESTWPIKQKYFPVLKKIEEEMHNQVKEMLLAGVIEPPDEGYASPVVMIRKSNGKYRF